MGWVTIEKTREMPRFSDIFVYDHVDQMSGTRWVFTECYLLKQVGPHAFQCKFDSISFDVQGMYLMFENHPMGEEGEKYGPYTLSTS